MATFEHFLIYLYGNNFFQEKAKKVLTKEILLTKEAIIHHLDCAFFRKLDMRLSVISLLAYFDVIEILLTKVLFVLYSNYS